MSRTTSSRRRHGSAVPVVRRVGSALRVTATVLGVCCAVVAVPSRAVEESLTEARSSGKGELRTRDVELGGNFAKVKDSFQYACAYSEAGGKSDEVVEPASADLPCKFQATIVDVTTEMIIDALKTCGVETVVQRVTPVS